VKTVSTLLTVTLWFIVTAFSAYAYVVHRLQLTDLGEGYVRDWQFQLWMFAIFRLPLFVCGLILLLWLVHRWQRKQPSDR
jgi:hypothetical protein